MRTHKFSDPKNPTAVVYPILIHKFSDPKNPIAFVYPILIHTFRYPKLRCYCAMPSEQTFLVRHINTDFSVLYVLVQINYKISTDVEVTTYNGLESCIFNSSSYDEDSGVSGTTGADGCVTADSQEDEASSCSSKDVDGSSFSSQCLPLSKQEENSLYELDTLDAVHLHPVKGKNPITYALSAADIETMKEKFAKLLLGDDVSGGARGVCAALALSNGITNLSGTLDLHELSSLVPLLYHQYH